MPKDDGRPPCPTPSKVRYATTVLARAAADRDAAIHGKPHFPYPCACGWWHLSTELKGRKLLVSRDGTVYPRRKRKKADGRKGAES